MADEHVIEHGSRGVEVGVRTDAYALHLLRPEMSAKECNNPGLSMRNRSLPASGQEGLRCCTETRVHVLLQHLQQGDCLRLVLGDHTPFL